MRTEENMAVKEPNDFQQAITEECQAQRGNSLSCEPVSRADFLLWLYKIEREFQEVRTPAVKTDRRPLLFYSPEENSAVAKLKAVADDAVRLLSPPCPNRKPNGLLSPTECEQPLWDSLKEALTKAGYEWEENT